MTRETGFYWVRLYGDVWQVAEFDGQVWWLCGADVEFCEADMEEISPRIERPR